ncbi:unnamed protein product, partial [Cuscuta europaea]
MEEVTPTIVKPFTISTPTMTDHQRARYGGRYNPHTVEHEDGPSTAYEEEDDRDYEQFSGNDDATTNSDDSDDAHDTTWADIELEQPYVEPANRDNETIAVGKIYDSYDLLKEAVTIENIRQSRIFKTEDKRVRSWKAVCIYDDMCMWHIQAGNLLNTNLWKVKKYQPLHNCRVDYKRARNDRLMTSKIIASGIATKVHVDPDYSIKLVMQDIYDKFRINVKYKKAWYGRLIALERRFGNWEAAYNDLPNLLLAIRESNPGSVVDFQPKPTSHDGTYEFHRAFWAFKASIDGFEHCLPVISVDGTHLYGKFKGHLLVAVAMNANREIFPLAYAVVESENTNSWSWFLEHIMTYVVRPNRHVCIISDRHPGILSAYQSVPQLKTSQVSKRFCLRHIRSNFMTKFRSTELKKLCWQAGSTPMVSEFYQTMAQIRATNENAFTYLNAISRENWAMCFDDGRHYGILTTNLSESFNNVLKGCRALPIIALVKATYNKVVQLFADRRRAGQMWRQAGFLYPQNIWKDILERSQKRHQCTIVPHNRTTGIYSVSIRDYPPVTVNLSRCECDCGFWKQNGFPCVHAYATCHFLEITVDHLIPDVYKLGAYIRTYATDIMPMHDVSAMPDTGYVVIPPQSARRSQTGRPQRTRFTNEMDMRPSRRA